MSNQLETLLSVIRECRLCEPYLPLGPKPVLRASQTARLLVVGQAPGTRVHATGTPWNDLSGDRLRGWLGMTRELFYDESRIAIVPMGFCYPGKGKSGDMPPRPECSKAWHGTLIPLIKNIQLTLLIGQYAQTYFLGKYRKATLTETVRAFKEYLPNFFPLPHPSPRNQLWLSKNPWFQEFVLPALRTAVARLDFK